MADSGIPKKKPENKNFSPEDLRVAEDLFHTLRATKKRKDLSSQNPPKKEPTVSTYSSQKHSVRSEFPTKKIILILAAFVFCGLVWSWMVAPEQDNEKTPQVESRESTPVEVKQTPPGRKITRPKPNLKQAIKTPPQPKKQIDPKNTFLQLNPTQKPTAPANEYEDAEPIEDIIEDIEEQQPVYDDFRVGPRDGQLDSPRLTRPIGDNDALEDDVINPDEFVEGEPLIDEQAEFPDEAPLRGEDEPILDP